MTKTVVPPKLKLRTRLLADNGTIYEVAEQLGQGGFGTTYVGYRLSAAGNRRETVCIKVCQSRRDWHGEAFFGELLASEERVVRLLDAFVFATGSGAKQSKRYVLIFDYMDGGTVQDTLEKQQHSWTEAHVRREIKQLLRVLGRLHGAGASHRDIKPDNVYVQDGRLLLGDFGITKMAVEPGQKLASALAPAFASKEVLERGDWWHADDVYQIGLLAGTLLTGEIWQNETPSIRAIAELSASDAMKSWIWHATGARAKRYWDAYDALDALDSLTRIRLEPGRAPRSLAGCSVVFTGRIPDLPRHEAAELARARGAVVQASPTDVTDLVVVGKVNAGGAGANEGLKLFAVRERLRLGQEIRLITAEQFTRMVRSRG